MSIGSATGTTVITSGESSVLCTPDSFEAVQQALAAAGLKPSRAEVVMRPANRVAIPAEAQETLLDLIDWLEELDDVHEIYHNAVLPPDEAHP